MQIDRYVIERELGSGGMGVVYLATDPQLKRKVVIKLLRDDGASLDQRARLQREAQAMAQVSHPNVVPVFDVGVHDDQVFLAMELVDGSDLATWLAEPRTTRAILDAFLAAGRGLAAAHAKGLVHRDFKPHNVMVARTGEVKVTDFGLARAESDETREAPSPGLLGSAITHDGTIVGTPAYMAPEQKRAGVVDARADQYSFCVALREALADQRVPRRVREAIRRGTAEDPAERFVSMAELLVELRPDPKWPIVAATLAGLAVIATSTVFVLRGREPRCATDELAAAWPARRGELEQAFRATRSPVAPAAASLVAGQIERFAASWLVERHAACEAASAGAEACLRGQRIELEAMLDLFVHPDTRLVESASDIATHLPQPAACRSAAVTPFDPALRAALAKAKFLRHGARYDEAAAQLAAATTSERRLLAELELERAAIAETRTDYAGADAHYTRVAELATELDDKPLRALAAVRLAAAATNGGKLDAATARIANARAVIGDDHRLAGELEATIGALETQRGNVVAAEAAYRRAIEHFTATDGGTSRAIADVRMAMGTLFQANRDYERAYRELEAMRDYWDAMAPHGPQVASALAMMSAMRAAQGRGSDAVALGDQAIAILTAYYGPDHWVLAPHYTTQADALFAIGKATEAIALAKTAIAIDAAAGKRPDDEATLAKQEHLAYYYMQSNHPDEALAILEAIVAVKPTIGALTGIGILHKRAGRFDQAFATFDRARELLEPTQARSPAMADMLTRIGATQTERAQFAAASEVLARALAIRAETQATASSTSWTRFELARAVWETDRTRGVELARKAASEATADHDTEQLGQIQSWLESR